MSNLILKSPVNKETFKTTLNECIKKAWVWDSKNNFETAVSLHKNKVFTFEVSAELEDDAEFNDSAVSIDLFDAYLNTNDHSTNEETDFKNQWEQAWESIDGFDLSVFNGTTIEDGLEFGKIVQQYFDILNSIENEKNNTSYETVDLSDFRFLDSKKETLNALKNSETKYLYEPSFSFENDKLRIRCDVLKIKENNHVEIFEAKATTKVKKEHFFDLVYQAYVLEKNGFIVDNISIVRINPIYVRNWNYNKIPLNIDFGKYAKKLEKSYGLIDYEEIKDFVNSDFKVESNDEISDIDFLSFVEIDYLSSGTTKNRNTLMEDYKLLKKEINLDILLTKISHYLSLKDEKEIIDFLSTDNCLLKIEKLKSNHFDYSSNSNSFPWCFHAIKYFDKYEPGFWNITKLNKKNKADLILHSKSPYFKDYETLKDPEIKLNQKGLSYVAENQKSQRMFEVYNLKKQNPNNFKKWNIVDFNQKEKIIDLLQQYENYPVYMYDFETSSWAIPRFNKTNSYYQVPFQYSIDVLIDDKYDYNDTKTMPHFDFLSNEVNVDPRPKFIENFIKDCFKCGPGVYVAYNDSFEKGVLRKLAMLFPEYAKPLIYIIQHTIDLMDFFCGNKKEDRPFFLIYHPDFMGSYSIKKTQPSLDNSFSYNNLVINKGDKASETFRKFVDNQIPLAAWNLKIKEGMFKYCNRDTLAMVVILKRTKEIFKESSEKN